jgi:hypothetical protein
MEQNKEEEVNEEEPYAEHLVNALIKEDKTKQRRLYKWKKNSKQRYQRGYLKKTNS